MVPGWSIFWKRSELDNPTKFAVSMLVVIVLTRALILFYNIFDPLFPGASLVSEALGLGLGLAYTGQFILRRGVLRAHFGDRAYSVGLSWIAMPGLTCVAVAFAHVAWIDGGPDIPQEIALVPSIYLLATALLIWARALHLFGMDTLAMVYVYFPEEGRMIQSDIYGVIRHPIYSAVIRVCIALALINGSGMALASTLLVAIGMTLWVRLGEEPELIARFGEGYREYRRCVPAFFNLNPRTWPVLWRFALLGR